MNQILPTRDPTHQVIIKEITNKTLTSLDFKGKNGEKVKLTLVKASISNTSIRANLENVSDQTVRNYVKQQGLEVAEKILHKIQEIAKRKIKIKTIDISIDWTEIPYEGEKIEGVGGSKQGYAWKYAVATTKYRNKTLMLAFLPYTDLPKEDIVKTLVEQVISLGFRIRIIALDAGFYSNEVIDFVSQFKFIISVSRASIRKKYDGDYETNKGVRFRPVVVKRHGKYLRYGTNICTGSGSSLVKLYNKKRGFVESFFRNVKEFLPFTCSRSFVFRLVVFLLAVLIYTLYLIVRNKRFTLGLMRSLLILYLSLLSLERIDNEIYNRIEQYLENCYYGG
ncbi:DUF4322 domain-containing protein [Sulfolobus tengchongensis]|uniref:DUF4322 domain-containing protein n=1 Tax=Sulfolobus tengchongensis TaxID=207809 RepID=A0AAX4KXH8_9CREN